jgi:ribonucleoside-diphosphate reductase alpha chain
MVTTPKRAKADPAVQVPLSNNAVTVLERRYLIKDETGRVIETPDEMFHRVALNLAEAEAKWDGDVALWEARFYAMMRSLKFLPNSPTLMNAGRPLQQLSACFVLPVGDDLGEIFATIRHQALIHKTGGGTGFAFSRLRPKNDIVMTTKGKASGPVSFMQVFDAATGAIKQGGTRRGANMAILSIDHPDIEEFIDMKNDLSVMTNFNVSVALTERFMQEVERDGEHDLVNPRTGVVAKTVRARDLFDRIVHSAWRTGEPGIVFIDRINHSNANPTPQLGMVESTNPCVAGDTRLHTQYGLMTMRALYESQASITATVDNRVVNEHRGTTTRPAVPVFLTAHDADVFRVVTADGYEVRATEWHDFFTTTGKKKLRDLQIGDELLVQSGEGQWGTAGDYRLGLLLGLLTGDGYITADRGACVNLWGADQALMPAVAEYVNEVVAGTAQGTRKEYEVQPVVVPERDLSTLRSVRLGRILDKQYGFTAATKLQVPDVVWGGSRECVIGYLHGLFQTDGTVNASASKESCSIRLASSTPTLLRDVQRLLANFGVFSSIRLRRKAGERLMPDGRGSRKTYYHQAQYDLIIDGESRTHFMEAVGFPLPHKADKLRAWAEGRVLRKTQPFTSPVKAIVYEGESRSMTRHR